MKRLITVETGYGNNVYMVPDGKVIEVIDGNVVLDRQDYLVDEVGCRVQLRRPPAGVLSVIMEAD